MHASPFHGFSVEFSEHRRYVQGDDPKLIDWLVYAKTDRFYIKEYQAETNITGYLVMDLSESMAYTHRQELTKFDYCICLAAALGYLMIHQQDPVGLITFDESIRASLPARSKRTQLANVLAQLARAKPGGLTEVGANLARIAAMIRHRSLLMVFSDLLADPDEVIRGLQQLRHAGHDVIVFHVQDPAELEFDFAGSTLFRDVETGEELEVDPDAIRETYLDKVQELINFYRKNLIEVGIDYHSIDTRTPYDHALWAYLGQRQSLRK